MKRIYILLLLGFVISGCGGKTPTNTPTPMNTSTPTPMLGVGSTQFSPKDGMEMVYVPAGEFVMGSEDGEDDEKPMHTIYLDAFWIDKFEVTNGQYADFLNEMGNQTEGGVTWLDTGANSGMRIQVTGGEWQAYDGYNDHPVEEVSWYGAAAYCEWAGRRLPTEAEWEKAARGEDGRTYPWGEGIESSQANYDEYEGGTTPVGSYPDGVSPYGALDMAGNVWEWVSDWYDENFYSSSLSENPQGPSDGTYRVLRGGAWIVYGRFARSAVRNWWKPFLTSNYAGFRCVASP